MTKVGCDSSWESAMMVRIKKRKLRQAQAVSAGGSTPRPPARNGLRAIAAAAGLAVVVSLSPELTQAPTRADEPSGAVDGAAARVSQPVSPVAGVAPVVDVDLPPSRPSRVEAPPALKPTASASSSLQFQTALDAARIGAGTYGATFAVVRDGKVVWAGSSGVERDGLTRLTADSEMVIGSVTKTFVAATVLELVDEGTLSLDDSVRQFLPEVRQVSREITIRQLLDHTSGLADVFNDATRRGLEEHPERAWSTPQLLAALHAPWYQPGEGWAYANTNYYLLGMVVERVTGSTLEQELQRRFLDPLALRSTRTLTADDPRSALAPAWATIFWGSGAMTSSAGDLARWGDALYDDDIPQYALLDGRTARAMFKVNREDYGLGVKRFELSPRIGYGHTGLLNTYTTLLLHLPKDDITIAMLVNRTDVDLLSMIRQRPPDRGPSLLGLALDS
jgi:D-alanyl-D-alanine carboxypeptidase